MTQKVQFQFELTEILGKNVCINLSDFGNLRNFNFANFLCLVLESKKYNIIVKFLGKKSLWEK